MEMRTLRLQPIIRKRGIAGCFGDCLALRTDTLRESSSGAKPDADFRASAVDTLPRLNYSAPHVLPRTLPAHLAALGEKLRVAHKLVRGKEGQYEELLAVPTSTTLFGYSQHLPTPKLLVENRLDC